jgi:glycosyltransferase involved in cell wall biosynthesis
MTMNNSSARTTSRRKAGRPFFSICIPQYNRTDFLIAACATFAAQSFRDFEVCISDDCSTDGKTAALLDYLQGTDMSFVYAGTERNLRYDGNLRNAIGLSAGQYALLMGNDDGLCGPDVLQEMHDEIVGHQPVAVAISNYREFQSGTVYRRMIGTGIVGAGPQVAAATFRRYSFVSGVVLDGDLSRNLATDACDGSEMYQMYLGTRLIAAGGNLLSIDRVCVDKDLQIPGQVVDSYLRRPKIPSLPIVERPLPVGELLRVVASALEPYHSGAAREKNLIEVGGQLYRFIFPFWGVEYRRIQSWGYSLGILLAVRPTRLARGVSFSRLGMLRLWLMYIVGGLAALVIPVAVFEGLRPWLFSMAKRLRRLKASQIG